MLYASILRYYDSESKQYMYLPRYGGHCDLPLSLPIACCSEREWDLNNIGSILLTRGWTQGAHAVWRHSQGGKTTKRDVEILDYLQDAAGRWNLLFDLPIAHDRYSDTGV